MDSKEKSQFPARQAASYWKEVIKKLIGSIKDNIKQAPEITIKKDPITRFIDPETVERNIVNHIIPNMRKT